MTRRLHRSANEIREKAAAYRRRAAAARKRAYAAQDIDAKVALFQEAAICERKAEAIEDAPLALERSSGVRFNRRSIMRHRLR
jgi:hypothetical protein